MPNWKSNTIYVPPKNKEILTKIHDHLGERNVQKLTFDGNLWWAGSNYVYYTPTHWSEVEADTKPNITQLNFYQTINVLNALEVIAEYDGHPENMKSIAKSTLRNLGYKI